MCRRFDPCRGHHKIKGLQKAKKPLLIKVQFYPSSVLHFQGYPSGQSPALKTQKSPAFYLAFFVTTLAIYLQSPGRRLRDARTVLQSIGIRELMLLILLCLYHHRAGAKLGQLFVFPVGGEHEKYVFVRAQLFCGPNRGRQVGITAHHYGDIAPILNAYFQQF